MKTAVVTGASKGIGAALCDMLIEEGYRVYGLSRTDGNNNKVVHITCDVTDTDSVKKAFDTIVMCDGKIDLLINNAGMGISGAAKFTSEKEYQKQINVNFYGSVNCTRECLHAMRKQNSGRIIFVSSLAAVFPIPFQSFYSASKAAVLSYASAILNEVKPFNIEISTLLLGDIKSCFTDNREKNTEGTEEYGGRIEKAVLSMEHDEQNGMTTASIAQAVKKMLGNKHLPPVYVIGFKYKLLNFLRRIMPVRLQMYILSKLY